MAEVVLIDYGAGNVQSVKYALERLGVNAILTNNIESIQKADKIIFPGVGEARSAMEVLDSLALSKVLPKLEQDFLGICLGMQLMCKFSEERNTECLGIFEESVEKFNIQQKVPHMGWNTVQMNDVPLLKNIPDHSSFYFVHSYFVPVTEHTIGTCNYEHDFCAILQSKNFYGCQFHPEKSGEIGSQLIQNFLDI